MAAQRGPEGAFPDMKSPCYRVRYSPYTAVLSRPLYRFMYCNFVAGEPGRKKKRGGSRQAPSL
jgi:hypothetical protein